MAYATGNPTTKKMLKEWVKSGKEVRIFNYSGMYPTTSNGVAHIEGPHYPKPHRWYAQVQVEDGKIVKVLS